MAMAAAGKPAPASLTAAMTDGTSKVMALEKCVVDEKFCHFTMPAGAQVKIDAAIKQYSGAVQQVKKAVAKKVPASKPKAVVKKAAAKPMAKPMAKPVAKVAVKKPVAVKAVAKKAAPVAGKAVAAKKPVAKRPSTPKPVAKKAAVKAPIVKKAAAKKIGAPAPSPWQKATAALAAPADTVPPVVGLSPWLARPRELAALEAAIKPRREKPKASARKPAAKKPVKKAAAKPVAKKAKAVRVAKPKPTGPAKPAPRRRRGLKKVVVVLKAALKVKKPPGPVVEQVLRADYGEGMKGNKDAERLLGVSRQVH